MLEDTTQALERILITVLISLISGSIALPTCCTLGVQWVSIVLVRVDRRMADNQLYNSVFKHPINHTPHPTNRFTSGCYHTNHGFLWDGHKAEYMMSQVARHSLITSLDICGHFRAFASSIQTLVVTHPCNYKYPWSVSSKLKGHWHCWW
jgi:hypothetical protein